LKLRCTVHVRLHIATSQSLDIPRYLAASANAADLAVNVRILLDQGQNEVDWARRQPGAGVAYRRRQVGAVFMSGIDGRKDELIPSRWQRHDRRTSLVVEAA